MKHWLILGFSIFLMSPLQAEIQSPCPETKVCLQVLGSGGPESQDKRASSSYLIWQGGKARILIDAGGGSALRFGQSGANMADLYAVAFTHLHIDHSGDFPALIKSSFFENRTDNLPVFAPEGNTLLPSATQFVDRLFNDENGVWPYLSDFLPTASTSASYQLKAKNIPENYQQINKVLTKNDVSLSAISVKHGPLKALAWRIDIGGHCIVISGDMNGSAHSLEILAKDADLLIAHNAVPENAQGVARKLHMTPSVIGEIAKAANVKKLLLSHRMLRTLGKEQETLKFIRNNYQGKTVFANDLDSFTL